MMDDDIEALEIRLIRAAHLAADLASRYENRDTAEWHLKEIEHLAELARIQVRYAQRALQNPRSQS